MNSSITTNKFIIFAIILLRVRLWLFTYYFHTDTSFFFFTNYNQPYKGLVAKVVHFLFFGGIGFSIYSYIYKHNYNKCLIVEYLVSHANIIIINYYINNYHIYIYIYFENQLLYMKEREQIILYWNFFMHYIYRL